MQEDQIVAILWVAMIVLAVVFFARHRRRRGQVGSAGAGSVYDWLHEDKRKAIEIVVEGRAAVTDPETRDETPRDGVGEPEPVGRAEPGRRPVG